MVEVDVKFMTLDPAGDTRRREGPRPGGRLSGPPLRWERVCNEVVPGYTQLEEELGLQSLISLFSFLYQDPQSMGFSRQEYCSGVPFPSPGDLPYPGIEPG